jgi:hypothetical protein
LSQEPLISALETTAEQADPSRVLSPVYQELQRHEPAGEVSGGICLLLTGLLFQHHFSAAISLQRDRNDPAWSVLEFDLADRCRAPVDSLAATYLVRLGSSALVDANPQAIRWDLAGSGSLELSCDPPGTMALAEAGRAAVRVQALAHVDPAQFTHRLRYRWRWRASS